MKAKPMKLLAALLCLALASCAPLTPQQRTQVAMGAGKLVLMAGEAYLKSQTGYAK